MAALWTQPRPLLYLYQYGFQFYKMGYACAAAYVLFILVFIVSLIQNISSKKWADLTEEVEIMATQAIAIKKKKSTSAIVRKVLLYVLLIIIGIIMVVPFLWMISTSLKEQYDTVKIPPVWIPNPPRWQNYVDLFTQQPMLQFMLNTIKIVFFVVLGQLFFSSLAAYSFARIKFKGRTVMFFFYIATLMVPGQVTMIPTYLMFAKVGLVDNHIVLILPAFFSAFGVFLLRQFFMSLPKELEEAAR